MSEQPKKETQETGSEKRTQSLLEQGNGIQDAETEGAALRMWRQEEGRTARVSLILGRHDSML